MRLQGRTAVVTGGGSGIGRAIALAFSREGARVVVADLREEPRRGKYHETDVATPTVAEIRAAGGQAVFVGGDIADEEVAAAVVERAVEEYGGLDILVNNAGVHIPGGTQEISVADWDRVLGVNLRAPFVLSRLAIPHCRRSQHGRIVHVASVNAYGGGAGPPYAAAKAALVNLTRDTALEVAKDGITVNAICPGYIETALQDYMTPEQIDGCRARTPLPRLGRPADIAHAAVFLASDEAEWITGTALVVDGGFIAPV